MWNGLISKLYISDDNPRLCVRLSRLWDFTDSKDDSKIFHTDLVLIDEMVRWLGKCPLLSMVFHVILLIFVIIQGSSIHAQIFPPHLYKYKPLLTEGRVYYLESYRVRDANRLYRPVANDLMISFTPWTTVEECIDVSDDFPTVVYSLTPYTDIPSLVEKKESFVGISQCSCLPFIFISFFAHPCLYYLF